MASSRRRPSSVHTSEATNVESEKEEIQEVVESAVAEVEEVKEQEEIIPPTPAAPLFVARAEPPRPRKQTRHPRNTPRFSRVME